MFKYPHSHIIIFLSIGLFKSGSQITSGGKTVSFLLLHGLPLLQFHILPLLTFRCRQKSISFSQYLLLSFLIKKTSILSPDTEVYHYLRALTTFRKTFNPMTQPPSFTVKLSISFTTPKSFEL